MSALVTATTAFAATTSDSSGSADAGASPDAAADARASPGCLLDATGGITATRAPCVTRHSRIPADGGPIATNINIEGSSSAGLPITVRLIAKGQPPLGADTIPSPSVVYATAKTRNERGIEWEAISNVQGTFRLDVTSVRPARCDAGIYYELHGTLDAELPFTNLQVWSPVAPVSLRVTF